MTCYFVSRHADTVEWIAGQSVRIDETVDISIWWVELLFLTLKEGCRVETLQLASVERIERALAVYLVVAWRIGLLMRLGRACPD